VRASQSPILSIVIPTYDRPKYLRLCLESIVNQTSREFEVVVVCNGSRQDTYDLVNEFESQLPALKVVPIEENIWSWDDEGVFIRGVYKPGFEASSGEFVLFLSDDDALSEEFVERVVRIFALSPEIVAVTGSCTNRNLITGEETPVYSIQDCMRRPRLEDGRSLSLRYLSLNKAGKKDLGDPGCGWVVRSSLYRDEEIQDELWVGYFVEQYQYLLPQGLVAYDHEAIFYWGRHLENGSTLLNRQVGMLHHYQRIVKAGDANTLKIWSSRYGDAWAQRLKKGTRGKRFPGNMRYLWEAHPYDNNVWIDLKSIVQHPQSVKKFARTDAQEFIFWIILPRMLAFLIGRRCRRGSAALLERIRSRVESGD